MLVKMPKSRTMARPMPVPRMRKRLRGWGPRGSGVPGGPASGVRRPGRGPEPPAGWARQSDIADPNLVKLVGEEDVARHGDEEHGQVGDGVAEDAHGVTAGHLPFWARPHSRVTM